MTLDEALQRAVESPDPDDALGEVVSEVAREADIEALQDLSRRLRALILTQARRGESARDTALSRHLVCVLQMRVERHGDRDPETLYALSLADNRLGDRLRRSGVSERAKSHYEESIRLRRELVARRGDDVELKRALARSLRREGELDQSLSRCEDAIRGFSECVEIEREILTIVPKASAYRYDLVLDLVRLGSALWAAGRLTEGAAAIEESVKEADTLCKEDKDQARYRYALALARMSLAGLRDATGRSDEGRAIWECARAALEMLQDDDVRVRGALAVCVARVG